MKLSHVCAALTLSVALGTATIASAQTSSPGSPGTGVTNPTVVSPELRNAKPFPLPTVTTPAAHADVIIPVDGKGGSHYTVRKGQKIWLAISADSLNAIDVKVASKGMLIATGEDAFKLTDAQLSGIGFPKDLKPEGGVFTAAKTGHLIIKAVITRPTLGGVKTSWVNTIHITVK